MKINIIKRIKRFAKKTKARKEQKQAKKQYLIRKQPAQTKEYLMEIKKEAIKQNNKMKRKRHLQLQEKLELKEGIKIDRILNKYRSKVVFTDEEDIEDVKPYGAAKLKHFKYELDHVILFLNKFILFFEQMFLKRKQNANMFLVDSLRDYSSRNINIFQRDRRPKPGVHFQNRPSKSQKVKFRKQVQPKLKATRSVVRGTLTIVQNFQDTKGSKKEYKNFAQMDDAIDKFFDHDDKYKDVIPRKERMRRNFVHDCLLDQKKTSNFIQKYFSELKQCIEIFNKLIDNQLTLVQWLEYSGSMDSIEFENFLLSLEVPFNKNLFSRLFWLFDISANGVIEHREVIKIMDMVREHSLDQKIYLFTRFCSEQYNKQYFDYNALYKFLFKNLQNEEDRQNLKKHVEELVKEINPKNKNKITRQDLYKAAIENEDIKIVIEKNVRFTETQSFDHSGKKTTIFTAAGEEIGAGVFYPNADNLIRAFGKREEIYQDFENMKVTYPQLLKYKKFENMQRYNASQS